MAEGGDEEDGVDVRRHDLLPGPVHRLLAREGGAARQHGLDDRLPVGQDAQCDPVADAGELAAPDLAAGRLGLELAVLG